MRVRRAKAPLWAAPLGCLSLILFGCEGAVVVPSYDCGARPSPHPQGSLYAEALARECGDGRVPGCVLLVGRRGQTPWVGAVGFRDLHDGSPMCSSTLFRLASITKVYVATVIFQLVEEGKLSLSTTLASVLPEVADHIPSASEITVEQLLGHRSGLSSPDTQDITMQLDFIDRPEELATLPLDDRFTRYVYGRPLRFAPGTAFGYSNTGYDLLGRIAERVEGRALEDILRGRVFAPLSLSRSSLTWLTEPTVTQGYAFTGEGKLMEVTIFDEANVGPESPSGGLVSTAEETNAFFSALFGGVLVSQEHLALMERVHCDDPASCTRGYGLGLQWDTVEEPRAVGHAGALVGVSSYAYFFPTEDTTVVYFKNVKTSAMHDMQFLREVVRLGGAASVR